jgi:hypothetical protein
MDSRGTASKAELIRSADRPSAARAGAKTAPANPMVRVRKKREVRSGCGERIEIIMGHLPL